MRAPFVLVFAVTAAPPSTAPDAPHTPLSEKDFRTALGQFATGVTIVTACSAEGQPVGMTASSFNSVSLSPALVLWSVGNHSPLMPIFRDATHYVIHVLSQDQQALAQQFATRGIDRFAGVHWHANAHGVPLLEGALATFECQSRSQHAEGDHLILVGEVQRCTQGPGRPLIYHAGQLQSLPPTA